MTVGREVHALIRAGAIEGDGDGIAAHVKRFAVQRLRDVSEEVDEELERLSLGCGVG